MSMTFSVGLVGVSIQTSCSNSTPQDTSLATLQYWWGQSCKSYVLVTRRVPASRAGLLGGNKNAALLGFPGRGNVLHSNICSAGRTPKLLKTQVLHTRRRAGIARRTSLHPDVCKPSPAELSFTRARDSPVPCSTSSSSGLGVPSAFPSSSSASSLSLRVFLPINEAHKHHEVTCSGDTLELAVSQPVPARATSAASSA